jgi:hydrogenase maturation protease
MRRTAVLGLGNPMRTDDGAGLHAMPILSADGRIPRHIRMIEGGTLGLDLLHDLKGVTHLLALDAVDKGVTGGTLLRFANGDLTNLPVGKSAHLLGFADLMDTMRLLDDAPEEIVLLGIQPESTDWGVSLSPSVEMALKQLVEAAVAQILTWEKQTADPGKPHSKAALSCA